MKDVITAVGNFIRFALALIVVLFFMGLYRLLMCPGAFFH